MNKEEVIAVVVGGLLGLAFLVYTAPSKADQGSNYLNSPSNILNSPSNFDNSSSNIRNSPSNWDNSSSNTNATNGIFDSEGRRTGYEVTSPSGVVNRFDNEGNRTGYRRAR